MPSLCVSEAWRIFLCIEQLLEHSQGVMADIEGTLSKEEMEEIGLEPDQVKVLKGKASDWLTH